MTRRGEHGDGFAIITDRWGGKEDARAVLVHRKLESRLTEAAR
jgi:hypothetical protein